MVIIHVLIKPGFFLHLENCIIIFITHAHSSKIDGKNFNPSQYHINIPNISGEGGRTE